MGQERSLSEVDLYFHRIQNLRSKVLTKATKILNNIKKVTILLDREITNLKLTAVVALGPESSVNWYPTLSLKVPV